METETLTFTFGLTPPEIIAKQNQVTGPFYMTLRGEDLDIFCEVVPVTMYHDKAIRNEPWNDEDLIKMLSLLASSDNEKAWSLRSGILTTLNIEEI